MSNTVLIYFEDLVGNLFFSLRLRDSKAKRVSFSLIEEYGKNLSEEMKKKSLRPIIKVSPYSVNKFMETNADKYRMLDNSYIELLIDLSASELSMLYNGFLPKDSLDSILSDELLEKTYRDYKAEIESINTKNLKTS